MSNIEFEEGSFKKGYQPSPMHTSSLEKFLIKNKIIKTAKQAQLAAILICLAAIIISIAALLQTLRPKEVKFYVPADVAERISNNLNK
jgi:hypothetical protein